MSLGRHVVWALALGGLLLALDPSIQRLVQSSAEPRAARYVALFDLLGKGYVTTGLMAATLVLGLVLASGRAISLGLRGTIANVAVGAVVYAIKCLAGRARPFMDLGAYSFHGPTLDDRFHSFCSGTTAFAFATALAIGARYPALRSGAIALAILVAAGRVYVNDHFASDVFVSAAIAAFIAASICPRQDNQASRRPHRSSHG